MKRGNFITLEGIEGCGKSTQLRLLAERLTRRGTLFSCTREPGGTEVGQEIRKILLSEKSTALMPLSEALLYMADRFQHVIEVLKPKLEAGELVLCDRYHDSTIAYQGYARGIPLEWLHQIWQNSGVALDPDLTLLFDVAPEIGIERSLQKLKRQGLDEARFEKEKLDFHARVREGFLTLARLNPERIIVIDGGRSIEEIYQDVVQTLKSRLEPRIGYEIL